ncbi:hypothetical protein D3C78_1015010 [compost metagenome]
MGRNPCCKRGVLYVDNIDPGGGGAGCLRHAQAIQPAGNFADGGAGAAGLCPVGGDQQYSACREQPGILVLRSVGEVCHGDQLPSGLHRSDLGGDRRCGNLPQSDWCLCRPGQGHVQADHGTQEPLCVAGHNPATGLHPLCLHHGGDVALPAVDGHPLSIAA